MIAKQRSALQVEFISGVKLICYFVLYFCFLHWTHPPNMAVGDLAFYYILYIYDNTCTHIQDVELDYIYTQEDALPISFKMSFLSLW